MNMFKGFDRVDRIIGRVLYAVLFAVMIGTFVIAFS